MLEREIKLYVTTRFARFDEISDHSDLFLEDKLSIFNHLGLLKFRYQKTKAIFDFDYLD